jgi:hypothetical protein
MASIDNPTGLWIATVVVHLDPPRLQARVRSLRPVLLRPILSPSCVRNAPKSRRRPLLAARASALPRLLIAVELPVCKWRTYRQQPRAFRDAAALLGSLCVQNVYVLFFLLAISLHSCFAVVGSLFALILFDFFFPDQALPVSGHVC